MNKVLNQCDGCMAGLPLNEAGYHVTERKIVIPIRDIAKELGMSYHRDTIEYLEIISCQKDKYNEG